jgi:uncharacterized cupin superfamily protein
VRPAANVFDVEVQRAADDPPGFDTGYARLGPGLGAARIGMTVYELAPGRSICPYHYELTEEEWLICLTGEPTLRTPEGERRLRPGDACCFPPGRAGAHAVRNETDATLRVAMLSTKSEVGVAIYPDSNKLGVWFGDEHHMVRLEPQLDYWDGEAGT